MTIYGGRSVCFDLQARDLQARDLQNFGTWEFQRRICERRSLAWYILPRTCRIILRIWYMIKQDALNTLVNSDFPNSKCLGVKRAIKCNFRRFIAILTANKTQ